ncbi:MAG: hypothetical protein C5B47_05640 [Verrucomicrobia bacterium]|nr:MAG: hypothetical protein C5B47_05640 [Verrucomicrobiota bacterium]
MGKKFLATTCSYLIKKRSRNVISNEVRLTLQKNNLKSALRRGRDLTESIRNLPDDSLLCLAMCLTELRALKPYPGWHFDIAEAHSSSTTQSRRLIWNICHERRLQKPILHPWYHDSTINLYLGNDLSRPIYVGGCIEPNEFAFVHALLKEDMVMLDIGANDGLFSVLAALQVGKQGRVLSFEPSPRELARLQANICLNDLGNVTIFAQAVTDQMGSAQLRISEYGHEGQNTLGNFVWNVRQTGTQTVETCCLDQVPEVRNLHRLDLMKIDVEGAEHKVLKGAKEVIQKFKPALLLELLDKALQFQGSSECQLIQHLLDLGYRIYDFSETSGQPALSNFKKHSTNIVAVYHPCLRIGKNVQSNQQLLDAIRPICKEKNNEERVDPPL